MAAEGGGCHFHGNVPAKDAAVIGCANQRKALLVNNGKLDKTWQPIQVEKVERIEGAKGKEWKLSFRNPAVADKSKETLYLFFTLPGNFIAANFTGQ